MKSKRITLLLMSIVFIIVLSGCSKNNTTVKKEEFDASIYANNDYLITPNQLKDLLGSEELVLLDCNKPDMYKKQHIPGAISIGLHAFSDKTGKPGDPGWGTLVQKEELASRLEALGIDNDKTVVFYSNVFKGPGADGRAVWQLKQAGMDNVKLLVGGLSYWNDLGYETTNEVSEPIPTSNVVLKDYDESYSATKEYIHENLGKQVVIDVRTEGEYKGSQKVGEPRGGHITGAKHMLWTDLLNEDGTPKSSDDIKTIMADMGVTPEDDFTVY
ncbi:sulfurtransferase [Tepidibacter hydrothermalis]|uniref:thiosulfate sulfurtransferase n=1 Tax=Tepidibacter hydrothermalis TaxID=3036126 RepID=A0ABY8E8W2_9FIRM|nr:rhodanese-like domain-containing protein [Tepidibacter hydrothermalis]WFD09353.1 rhodanese-like domain-containing protein [Tepidibacter hydrothermalis]